ncbi:MAG: hypothetical protein JWM57_2420 [Phycisphaerales bacterium]|nr:hypothetical protein [Phycisphaerales bacterium]
MISTNALFGRRARLEFLEPRRLMAFSDLQVDTAFGLSGAATVDAFGKADLPTAAAVQADGRILVASQSVTTLNGNGVTAISVVRLNTNGSLDDGTATDTTPKDVFGAAGVATILFSQYGQAPTAIAVQADGKILVGGTVNSSSTAYWIITRLNADGSRDKTFGRNGVFTAFNDADSSLKAMTLQPDGAIIAVGSHGSAASIVRLTARGKLDATFNNGAGSADFDLGSTGNVWNAVDVDNVGNILLAGDGIGNGIAKRVVVTRLAPNGAFDTHFHGGQPLNIGGVNVLYNVESSAKGIFYDDTGSIILYFTEKAFNSDSNNIENSGARLFIDAAGASPVGGYTAGRDYSAIAQGPVGNYSEIGQSVISDENSRFVQTEPLFNTPFVQSAVTSNLFELFTTLAYQPDGNLLLVGSTGTGSHADIRIVRVESFPSKYYGSTTGLVYVDGNKNGVKDSAERFKGNVRVFADLNANGEWNGSEPTALTDLNGRYSIRGIPSGNQNIRLLTPSGYARTTNGSAVVKIASPALSAGPNFGVIATSSVPVQGADFATLVSGVLTIQGTGDADSIAVGRTKSIVQVTVNGQTQTFGVSDVLKLVIVGLGGNDKIGLASVVTASANIDGGTGNDFIIGGLGNDTINGGEGNNSILGGAGDDRLAAGSGADTIFGGEGRDRISGLGGNDSLSGDGGRDILSGGDGADVILGGASSDTLYGNAGDDILNGLGGIDYLDGGDGKDTAKKDNLDTTRIAIEVLV